MFSNISLANIIFYLACLAGVLFVFYKWRMAARKRFIQRYEFPNRVRRQVLKAYPQLQETDVETVIDGLKQYFKMNLLAKGRPVSMPSQAVDVAWHEFILFTRQYETFCKAGLGRFLHHTPAEAMKSKSVAQERIKRAWRLACYLEDMKPNQAHRLPLIFDLDRRLNIADGFHYQLNCQLKNGHANSSGYCASHIGCSSGCAGSSSAGGCSSSDGCSGGCGGD